MKCFARPPKFTNRIVMMLSGVILQGFGLSALIRLNLGTDPCSCLTQGVIRHIPVSFGTAQLLCHLVMFLFVVHHDMSMIGYGSVGNMVCIGYISDFFGWVWDSILPVNFFEETFVRFGLLGPVLAVFVLGVSTYMAAGLGSSPYDAIPCIMTRHFHKLSFKEIRIFWDIGFMTVGALLGGNAGIITIVLAFFLGPAISMVGKKMERFLV